MCLSGHQVARLFRIQYHMSADFQLNDDPALRSALKRALGDETAPESLRRRITQLTMDQAGWSQPRTQSARSIWLAGFWRRPIMRLAAAVFVLGLVGVYAVWQFTPKALADKPGPDVLAALVKTHDACCAAKSHSFEGMKAKDIRESCRLLAEKLHDPVLSADLRQDGWVFKGAYICNVGDQKSAHMIFEKDGRQMSVFSVSAPRCAKKSTCSFKQEVADHLVAGFVKNGRAYCLVGYSPKHNMKLEEVASLLEKHQDELTEATEAVAHVAW